MQKLILLLCFAALLPAISHSQTFAEWFNQKKTQKKYLLAQVVKLQLYLDQLKAGYGVMKDGLTTIGRFKDGEFSLHRDYFNHLKNVSPQVKTYSKALAIVTMQQQSFALYKNYRNWFTASGLLTATEQDYSFNLLANMLDAMALQVSDLMQVLTSGQVEMNDRERLEKVDRIYAVSFDIKTALQSFITDVSGLVSGRKQSKQDTETLQHLSPQ